MKRIFLPFLTLVLSFHLNAQPKAHEGTADFQHTTQPAALIELPYPQAEVEKGIDEFMSKKGLRGADNHDYRVYRGYKVRDTHDHTSDLYFKVDRKDRHDKDMCVVYLVIGKNGEDVKARTDGGHASLEGATDLLNELIPTIQAYHLELQIKDQEDLVRKNQKKYDNLVQDSVDYIKRVKALREKLDQNKKDRDSQQAELKKQSDILDLLRGKRVS